MLWLKSIGSVNSNLLLNLRTLCDKFDISLRSKPELLERFIESGLAVDTDGFKHRAEDCSEIDYELDPELLYGWTGVKFEEQLSYLL